MPYVQVAGPRGPAWWLAAGRLAVAFCSYPAAAEAGFEVSPEADALRAQLGYTA